MEIERLVEAARGKKILFVGRSNRMGDDDIELFLDQAGAQRAEDEKDAPLGMVVTGRLLNPIEEQMCDDLARNGIAVTDIGKIEEYYAAKIDREALIGSLKLFRNRERIINLLHNPHIGDDLFCEILKLYDWEGRGPFEGDENRDVAGTIVARFYPEIERNHNIQYSPVGPFLVAAQCENRMLLEAMILIPDYEITQRSGDMWLPATLHEALLVNPNLPVETLLRFCDSDEERKRAFAAMHPSLPHSVQERLAESSTAAVLEGLARNPSLSGSLREKLRNSEHRSVRIAFLSHQPVEESILENIESMDEESCRAVGRNGRLSEETALGMVRAGKRALQEELASNTSLTGPVYEALFGLQNPEIRRRLASNESVPVEILERLVRIREKEIFVALASNPSMPERYLRSFSKIRERDVAAALASNPSTPIEILLGYQTDAELSNILKRNEAFSDYIRRNIGW
ncbi:leucine rich repeat variant [Hydrogenimonas sp.]|nr:leucine rich repeat variant [Hydrogenimonas sp.]